MTNRRGGLETRRDFLLLGFKITVDSDCSHEITRHLLLGGKAMTNLDSKLKSRDHFANKVPYSQSCDVSSSHVEIESWAMKKAECRRIVVLKLWCCRRLLRVPWIAMRSNQSIFCYKECYNM